MGEKVSTREARRTVKRLGELYFCALKNRLREQNEAFWAKFTAAYARSDKQAPAPTEKP
jgi:hypothetical protein